MPDISELIIKTSTTGTKEVKQDLTGLAAAADKAGKAFGRLKGFLLGAALLGTAKAFADSSSAAQDLASRLEILSGSAAQAEAANRRLQQIAYDSGSDISQLTEAYISLGTSFKEVGFSAKDTGDFIDALNNALILSGAKGDQAAAVQESLARAMASGALRGVQLNTVIERGGKVAQLLAEELGTTTSGLREMGAQGKITAEVIQSAFTNNMETLATEVEGMEWTINDTFGRVGTALSILGDRFDEAWGRGSSLPGLMNKIADSLMELQPAAEAAGAAVTGATEIMAETFLMLFGTVEKGSTESTEEMQLAFEDAAIAIGSVYDSIASSSAKLAVYLIDVIGAPVKELINLFTLLGDVASAAMAGSVSGIKAAGRRFMSEQSRIFDEAKRALSGQASEMIDQFQFEHGLTQRLIKAGQVRRETLDDTRKATEALTDATEKAGKAGVDHMKQNRDAIRNLREEIYQAGLSSRELVQRQAELQLNEYATPTQISAMRALAIELEHAKSNANFADMVKDLEEQIYQASLSAKDLAMRQAELKLGEYATDEQIAKVRELTAELYRVNEAQRAGRAFEDMMAGLSSDADPSESEAMQRLRKEYEERMKIIAEAQEFEYESQIAYEEAILKVKEDYTERRLALMEKERAEQEQATLNMMANAVQIVQSQMSNMSNLFDEGTAMGKAFFVAQQSLAAANSIIQGLSAGMAIRASYAAMGPAGARMGEVHAKLAESMGYLNAGIIMGQALSFEGGGYTGQGFRSGGMDGKGGFMAMLHPNETVVDHEQGGSVAPKIVNVLDPSLIGDYLNTSRGEDLIINIMQRNQSALRV